MNKKQHWENIYNTKELAEVSWYQPTPQTAIDYIRELKISKSDAILDVGGGDSFFVDYLLDNGFTDISILDISVNALHRAKQRLGARAPMVNWLEEDVTRFSSEKKYDFWYDRAAFHFLTDESDIDNYIKILNEHISENGKVVIGTFSESGPTKCSGIEIKQYSVSELQAVLKENFTCISCQKVDHHTPFDTVQNFTFCSFEKK